MTRLPLEDRNVWGAPGPRYRPEYVCSHPFCDKRYDLELHHIWPRSFLRNQPRDWVKLPDGRVIGNLTYLCREHHIAISENKAQVAWTAERFFWLDELDFYSENFAPLSPQPPLSQQGVSDDGETPRRASAGLLSPDEAMWAGEVPDGKTPSEILEPIHPGEDCPRCLRRVPHPRKPSSPQTTVTKSWRLPASEKEDREDLLKTTAAHVGVSTKEPFWLDKTILKLCVLALQGPGE